MTLLGHDEAWTQWRRALGGERMHHAWLLAGKAGMGKMHFARAAARELVGAAPDMEHHPDIHVLTHGPKDKKAADAQAAGKPYELARNIKIDQVRAMQQRLNTRPTMGDKRAILIDPADDMEKGAANALLKSLEEPPRGTYFILISHRPARLLPTIRSRCRTLRFPVLPEPLIESLIAERAPDLDTAARDAVVEAAGGSPGAALAFIEHDLGGMAGVMLKILAEGDPGFVLRGQLAASIGARPNRERLAAALDLARSVLARDLECLDAAAAQARIETHTELVRLAGEMPTYNFDPGLLAMEIGTLLARAAGASERAYG